MQNDEGALGQFRKLLERAKKGEYRLVSPHRGLAAACSMLGPEEEARHNAAEVLRLDPKFSLERFAKWYPSLYKRPPLL